MADPRAVRLDPRHPLHGQPAVASLHPRVLLLLFLLLEALGDLARCVQRPRPPRAPLELALARDLDARRQRLPRLDFAFL